MRSIRSSAVMATVLALAGCGLGVGEYQSPFDGKVAPWPDAGVKDGGAPSANDAGPPVAPDEGGAPDAGASAPDAGGPGDAGAPRDAGTSHDGGMPHDAGTSPDAGAPHDAGTSPDAGAPHDAGAGSDAGTGLADAGEPADAGSASIECDPAGAIGYQRPPGVKSAQGALVSRGATTLAGETITGAYFTGEVRGYGTIRDSVIAAQTFIAVMNSTSKTLTLEDVTIGLEGQKMGDLAVEAEGTGGVIMRRVRIVGYADCLRNGPLTFENSWCTTTLQTATDHNDGYQAYRADETKVSIRCAVIENSTAGTNAGIFHADGSQVDFTIENTRVSVGGNYCVRLHSASKYGELPAGDSVDDSRLSVMRKVSCSGGVGYWVDGLPIGLWEDVTFEGALVSKP